MPGYWENTTSGKVNILFAKEFDPLDNPKSCVYVEESILSFAETWGTHLQLRR